MTSIPKIQKIGKTKFILVKGEKVLLNDIFELVGTTTKRKPTKLTRSVLGKYLKLSKCIEKVKKPTKKKPKKKPVSKTDEKLLKIGKESVSLQKREIKQDKKDTKEIKKAVKKGIKEITKETKETKESDEEKIKQLEFNRKQLEEALRQEFNLNRKQENDLSQAMEAIIILQKKLIKNKLNDEAFRKETNITLDNLENTLDDLGDLFEESGEKKEGKGQVGKGVVKNIKDWLETAYHMYTPMGRKRIGLGIFESKGKRPAWDEMIDIARVFDSNIWTVKKAKKYLRSKHLSPIKPVEKHKGKLLFWLREPKTKTKGTYDTDDAGVLQIVGKGKISELSDGIHKKIWAKVAKANRQNKTNFLTNEEGKRLSLKELKAEYDKSYSNRLKFHKLFSSFIPKPKEPTLNKLPEDSPKLERQDGEENGDIVAESEQTPTEQPQVIPPPILEGNGIKQGALSNYDIEKIMSKIKTFRGAIPYDKMPYIHLGQGNNSFIINTDDSNGTGKHWIAVYIDRKNKRVEFFDPFGEHPKHYKLMRPMKEFIRNRLDDGFYKLKWSTVKAQDPKTDGCGLHSIRYIMDRESGKKFKKASGFMKSISKNEDKISKMREKYSYIV